MPITFNEALTKLLNSEATTDQWQVKQYLQKIRSHTAKHGVSSNQILLLIRYVCQTTVISEDVKLDIIGNCLIPNDYMNYDIIEEILSHLGSPTIFSPHKIRPSKNVQISLCRWLVHVFLLLPKTANDECLSTLIHLWKFDYIQTWISYLIIWYTERSKQIKQWRIKLLVKTAKKPGYTNAAANASLILKRYMSIVGTSEKISRLISQLTYKTEDLKSLQNLQFDKVFIGKLEKVLIQEAPNRFSKYIIEDKLELFIAQLRDSDIDPRKLNFRSNVPEDTSNLYNIYTLHQLYQNWSDIRLPKNVEPLFPLSRHNIIQFYPLALYRENLSSGNKNFEEFWSQMYNWLLINLRNCFQKKLTTSTERNILFYNIIKNCQVFSVFVPRILNDFLTLENFLADTNLFVALCERLFPLVIPPNDLPDFRNRLLKILAICHLSKTAKGDQSFCSNTRTFPAVCHSMIRMFENWITQYADRTDIIEFSLDLLNDLRKLLLANLKHSQDDRNVSICLMILLNVLSSVSYKHERDTTAYSNFLEKLILKNYTVNKLITFDDPILMDACCKYLIGIKNLLLDRPATDIYVQLQNQYIMDTTNYLWRNKIISSRKFFNIPSDFIKAFSENLLSQTPNLKPKSIYSITGISAFSYVTLVAERTLEERYHTNIQYHELLTEEGFKRFSELIAERADGTSNVWIPNVETFTDLKTELVKQLKKMAPYGNTALFLFTYLKSLSKYKDSS
ncbi:hypothetical protein KAFR_0A06060 [Kazachstania africana CBS 2517]|uniref:Uncharacterized protein n=1 Tax=Kazachstania africana (strain ATCC 22294 / BCRC 22015 / CBS 2517 / CECT 1963 / NBRC 1671 / NRRL Y-8276) TaxID=1071382 RepID=H2ANU1_KAZAF|nr:hypothetical protein KAFR_0A06060 [Kazachstania africana CBS 2517]CCF56041.1 hypothetical protein KAFR_0A06060 [Kazachstania africana CBS 2517]